jgi:hypothetical protein
MQYRLRQEFKRQRLEAKMIAGVEHRVIGFWAARAVDCSTDTMRNASVSARKRPWHPPHHSSDQR